MQLTNSEQERKAYINNRLLNADLFERFDEEIADCKYEIEKLDGKVFDLEEGLELAYEKIKKYERILEDLKLTLKETESIC